jgi:hypothetical protein
VTPELGLAVQERITSWAPVPERPTDCGLPLALSVMVSAADDEPAAEGVYVTATVHVPPAATELPQVFPTSAKLLALVPVIAKLVILNAALPALVRVTVWAELVVSTGWLPKARLVVERVIDGVEPVPPPPPPLVPVPVRPTDGSATAVAVTVSVAERDPLATGVKVTVIVQLAPAAMLDPQPFVSLKSLGSAPVIEMPVMLKAALPVLLNVTD